MTKKAQISPKQQGEEQRFESFSDCNAASWHRAEIKKAKLLWLNTTNAVFLLWMQKWSVQTGLEVLSSLDLCLSSLGTGGVFPWHNLWKRWFPLGCFSFLEAKQRCSTQYHLSWRIWLQRWLYIPVQSKAGLSLFTRWKEPSCRLGEALKIWNISLEKPFPTEITSRTPTDSITGRTTVFIAPKPAYTWGHLTHEDSNQRQSTHTPSFSWNHNSGQHRWDQIDFK